MSKLKQANIAAIFVAVLNCNSSASETRPTDFLAVHGIDAFESPGIVFQLRASNKDESERNGKWNPALKYAVVAVTAGVGALSFYNGFTMPDRNRCDEAEDRDTPCLGSTTAGYVLSGLVMSVVAIGIAIRF